MLKKFVTLIMVICMLTVSCFSPLGIYAAGSTCILKSSEEITGGNSILYKWDGTKKSNANSNNIPAGENNETITYWSASPFYNYAYGLGNLSTYMMTDARTYTVKIPISGKNAAGTADSFGGGFCISVNLTDYTSNKVVYVYDNGTVKTIDTSVVANNDAEPTKITEVVADGSAASIYLEITKGSSCHSFVAYWNDTLLGSFDIVSDNNKYKGGVQRFEFNKTQSGAADWNENVGDICVWVGNRADEPVDTGVRWLCEDNKICLKGEKNTAYNVRLLNPKNGFNESYSISEYNAADSSGQASMLALDTALTTNSDGIAYLNHDFSFAGKYFAYLSSYAADVKAQSYFYIGGEKLLDNLSVNIDTPLFKEFVMSSLGVDSDASQKIINDYKTLTDKGFVDSAASGGYMDFYAAVLFGNMFEQTAYNENLADELKSALTSLGLPTAGFDVLLMNNDYSDVMKELSEEASTVNSAADMLFDISVLKGVKNAIIPSEAESFLALIGNSKFDNALPEQKSIIASALKGNEYDTISELSDAVDGVNITPTVSEDNNDELGNTNTGDNKIDFDGGSSSSGPSSPKPSAPTITPTPDDTPTNPEPVTPPEKAEPVEYNDVPDTHWAYESIGKMSEMGIISGYDGNFNPDNDVTRAEYIKMLCKIFGISESTEAVFGDVSSNDWYAPFVYGAAKEGLVSGDGTNFRPNDSISREDAAVMLYRFMNYKSINFDKTNETTFADSSEFSIYAVEAIENLAAAGIINGKGDGIFAALDSMTRAEAAKLLLGAISE